MLRFNLFNNNTTNTATSNPSHPSTKKDTVPMTNTKNDTVPMIDLETGFKYEVKILFSQPKPKTPSTPAPKNVDANYDTYRDYERGISMPW